MDEAERLADRIGILDHGTTLALDTPADLTREQSTNTVEVRFPRRPAPDMAQRSARWPRSARRARRPGTFVVETGDAPSMLVELTTFLRDKGMTLPSCAWGAPRSKKSSCA